MPDFVDFKARHTQIVWFLGMRRSGKTTTMRECIRKTSSVYPALRWIIWDGGEVQGQYIAGKKTKDGKFIHSEGSLPIQKSYYYETTKQLEGLVENFPAYRFHVVGGKIDFSSYVDAVIECSGCIAVVSEIDRESSKFSISPDLDRLFQTGAHVKGVYGYSVSLFVDSRRFQNTHNNIVSNIDTAFVHRVIHSDDRKKLEKEAGLAPGELTYLKDLEKGECVRFDGWKEYAGDEKDFLVIHGMNSPNFEGIERE